MSGAHSTHPFVFNNWCYAPTYEFMLSTRRELPESRGAGPSAPAPLFTAFFRDTGDTNGHCIFIDQNSQQLCIGIYLDTFFPAVTENPPKFV